MHCEKVMPSVLQLRGLTWPIGCALKGTSDAIRWPGLLRMREDASFLGLLAHSLYKCLSVATAGHTSLWF